MYMLFDGLKNTSYLHVHVLRTTIYVALISKMKEILRFLETNKDVFSFSC
jgi:hypothetical protein